MKRILRGPWVWAVLALVGVLLALNYLVPNGGYTEVSTSTLVKHLKSGDVKSVTFVDGGDQKIQVKLANGKKEYAFWVDGQQVELAVPRAGPPDREEALAV